MDAVRIGIVGCGAMGQGHADAWLQTPGARVTAVCDPDESRSVTFGERLGARAYSDLAAMCASGDIDAVDIVTPSGLHASQAMVAARHGRHILCEKPLDLNLAMVDALIELCDRVGVTLACIFQRRTYSGARQVADAIHAGRMGRLLSCSAHVKWWRPQAYYASAAWRGTWALDGGVLANQAIHAIDHMCWLAGPVEEVEYAHLATASHTMEAEDFALVALRFRCGARGVIEATTCSFPDLASRVEVFGTRGAAAFEDATVVNYGVDGEDLMATLDQDEQRIGGGSAPMAISLKGHAALMEDFVASIREGRPPLIPGREARHSVEALSLIYQKAFPGIVLGTPPEG